jgi:hypothetical protein
MSAYTANLTAGLTVNRVLGGIETLSQMEGHPFAVLGESSIETYFRYVLQQKGELGKDLGSVCGGQHINVSGTKC